MMVIHTPPTRIPIIPSDTSYHTHPTSEIVDKFGFEFKMNPLTYPGGGKIITGLSASAEGQGLVKMSEPLSSARRRREASLAQHAKKRAIEMNKQHTTKPSGNNNNNINSIEGTQYDGFTVGRLMQAERSIQLHLDRRRMPPKTTHTKANINADRYYGLPGCPPPPPPSRKACQRILTRLHINMTYSQRRPYQNILLSEHYYTTSVQALMPPVKSAS